MNLLKSAENIGLPYVPIENLLIFGDGSLKRTIVEIIWKHNIARVHYIIFLYGDTYCDKLKSVIIIVFTDYKLTDNQPLCYMYNELASCFL